MSSEQAPNPEGQTNLNTNTNSPELSQEEIEEQKHFSEVQQSFIDYYYYMMQEYGRRAHAISILPKRHLELFPPNYFQEKLSKYKQCITENTSFLSNIVFSASAYSGRYGYPNQNAPRALSNMRNMNKVVSTLHQFVRDWSVEGQKERDEVYKPIIDAVLELVPIKPNIKVENESEKPLELDQPRVLCPGSGLCRLPFEFAAKGYTSQCNEFSYQMLLAANYVLNKIEKHDEHTIYPFIDNPNNIYGTEDNVRPVKIPDVAPSEVLTTESDFSMCAGEFLEVYNEYDNYWDVVASCFFLDTAPNIIEYLECIYKILKPNGYLINVGPLLYHWSSDFDSDADIRCEQSIELSYEELKEVMSKIGFKIIKENRIETSYTANERSMMHTVYNAVFFVAQK